MVGRSISGTQKDVDTKSDSDRCVALAADGLQLSTFRVSKDEPGRRWERHTISMRPPITLVKTFQIQETSGFGDCTRHAGSVGAGITMLDRFCSVTCSDSDLRR